MSGLDHWIAGAGRGGGLGLALLVALLLGLRHATDPDHLTAVSTLALWDDRHGPRRAATLGMGWGLGHATTLIGFGIPALLLRRYLPDAAERAAEGLIGAVIVILALRLLVRWRRGYLHSHPHRHGDRWHTHPHAHADADAHARAHAADHDHAHAESLGRSPLTAYGIGLIHGLGGSAAVTVLLISAIPDRVEATLALLVFALATAVSMSVISAGFGTAMASHAIANRLERSVPLLGAAGLAFGVFYGLAAV